MFFTKPKTNTAQSKKNDKHSLHSSSLSSRCNYDTNAELIAVPESPKSTMITDINHQPGLPKMIPTSENSFSSSSSEKFNESTILSENNDYVDNQTVDEQVDDYDGVMFHYGEAYLAKLKGELAGRSKSPYEFDAEQEKTQATAETSDTASESSVSSDGQRECKVRFSTVSIRTYALTVGTSNIVKGGYPLSLDWRHTQTETLDMDMYEELFAPKVTSPDRPYMRGFRKPKRLTQTRRYDRLRKVTGKSDKYLYTLESKRVIEENKLPKGCIDADEGYEEDPTRTNPYQLVDVDEYQMVDI